MKVKEFAQHCKTTSESVINLLKMISIDKFTEDSELGKDLEKKLAKKYNVPYPFKKTAPKKVGAKDPNKQDSKPTHPTHVGAKPTGKPNNNNKPQGQRTVKPGTSQGKPSNDNRGSQGYSNRGQNDSRQGQGYNNNRGQNDNRNDRRDSRDHNGSRQFSNKPGQGNGQYNNKPRNTKDRKQKPEVQIRHTERPKDIPSYKDVIVESTFDEAIEEKYEGQYNDETYDNSVENKMKQAKKSMKPTGNKKPKKEKVQKSRAEKLAGNIKTKKEDNVIYFENNMTVQDVAEQLNLSVTELVKKLFTSMGVFASATQSLDRDTVELIGLEYNYEVKDKQVTDLVRFDEIEIEDDPEDLVPRPAIVTIMGHVDHGKTTLLDTIRCSHVVKGEAGGITQHIGAYQVQKNGRLITFIDTPGHAAFTEMRARGAQVTDIVILVVAADDGVMPQTKEAIEHAQAANVPIIVAVNKMDKPGASADKIKQELMSYNLVAEDWGGDTIFVPISALIGTGVDELLEMVILLSDLKEYKANPNRFAVGSVIEARLDKGRGPVATLLVQNGTLHIGDMVVVGTTYGRVRAMQDEMGRQVKEAGPSKPVELTGLQEVPLAGEKFMALDDEKKAKAIAELRSQEKFNEEMGNVHGASLNEILAEDGEVKNLNLIIKCDVQGSIEAIKGLLEKINIEGTKINIISSRVGGVTDNDISLAIASHAIIIGFNIRPTGQISDLAKEKHVEIRLYNVIYKLQEDIEKAVKGMLDPVFEEKVTGEAEVRELFKISHVGTVAGSMVTNGSIVRNGGVRLIRDSIVIYTGKMAGLRRFKDDVKEVKEGYDCGITIEGYNDIKVGDRIECFIMEEQERE